VRVFVAGASGAIGQPLVSELVRQGHTVTGMTRSKTGSQKLVDMGATVAIVSAFDGRILDFIPRRLQCLSQ
jgi:2-alkyl-3-oxoalkanoate reductase